MVARSARISWERPLQKLALYRFLEFKSMKKSRKSIVGGFLLAVLAGVTVEWIKDFPVLRWLAKVGSSAWSWLGAFHAVPGWLLAVLATITLLACISVALRLFRSETEAPWLAVSSGEFFGLRWQWRYLGSEIDENSFHAFCPQCSLQLKFARVGAFAAVPRTAVVCLDCGFRKELGGELHDVLEKLALHADRHVRRSLEPARTV